MLLLCLPVWAASQLRAVGVQPTSLEELDDRPVRVWWNGPPARLELQDGGGWRSTDELSSGTLAPAAPKIRLGGDTVQPMMGLDPSGVARLFAPHALPGREVSDLLPTEEGVWAALSDGGLVFIDKRHLWVHPYGVAEGLPSAQVNAVAVYQEQVYAGTAAGLYAGDGRVWGVEEGLPDSWVQSLHAEADRLLVGTYRGLAALGEELVLLLGPLSVFWVGPGPEAPWVGYAGLRGVDDRPVEGVDEGLDIWDVETVGQTHYLATDTEGVLALRSGLLSPTLMPPGGAAFALHQQRGRLYVAAGEGGLVALEEGVPVQRWGAAEGLPGDRVYEVEGGPAGKLWVGTDDGLALMWPEHEVVVPWPVSPVAAGTRGRDLLGGEDFLLAATDEGVASVGKLPRGWRDATALPGPVVALESEGRVLWVVGEDHLWRLERGRLSGWPIDVPVSDALLVAGNLWLASEEGLYRFDAGLERVVPGPRCGPVRALSASSDGLLWVAAEHRVMAVARNGDAQDYLRSTPALDLVPHRGQVLVATATGLESLDPSTGALSRLPGFDEEILALVSDGQQAWVLDASLRVRSVMGLPRVGLPELWTLGVVGGLRVDEQGRIWAFGERGFALL